MIMNEYLSCFMNNYQSSWWSYSWSPYEGGIRRYCVVLELNGWILIFLLRVGDVLNHKLAVRVLAVLLDGLGNYQSPLCQWLRQRFEVEIDLRLEINDLVQDDVCLTQHFNHSIIYRDGYFFKYYDHYREGKIMIFPFLVHLEINVNLF